MILVADQFEERVHHLADHGAVRVGLDGESVDSDLQHLLLRQDRDRGVDVWWNAFYVAQLGDVGSQPDGGGF